MKRLAGIASSAAYPKGATLFVEGQPARGLFVLCSGRVKLSTCSADGKTLILRISEPGEVLGLPATVTGTCYELTADVIEPGQANFIARTDFLSFLKDSGEAALRVAQQLGMPIVPVSLVGSFQHFRTGHWMLWPGKVTVYLHDVIETKGLAKEDVPSLRDRVREIISTPVEESRKGMTEPSATPVDVKRASA